MTDENRYGVVIASGVGNSKEWFLTPQEAWDYLLDLISRYLERLEEAGLTGDFAAWDMFKDDLLALSLKPWVEDAKIEGPDGMWYGVTLDV